MTPSQSQLKSQSEGLRTEPETGHICPVDFPMVENHYEVLTMETPSINHK